MAVVLFAWELGAGLGHLGRMVPVAKELAQRGHQPVFAVRNLRDASRLVDGEPFDLFQAPRHQPRREVGERRQKAATYADLLARQGFANEADVKPIVAAWDSLITLVRPALIVADHSPTACLAAFGRIPVAQLGDGFTLPPVESATFYEMGSGGKSAVSQSHILDTVQAVQRQRGYRIPESLSEIFATDARFVTTFSELDPYRRVREEAAMGPLKKWRRPTTPHPHKPSVFIYLSGDYPQLDQVLLAFVEAGVACSAYLRDANPASIGVSRAGGVEVHDAPQHVPELLPNVSAVVHHAGLNMTAESLAAGRPQLVLPRHFEQDLNSAAMQELGVGRVLGGQLTRKDIGQSLRSLIEGDQAERAHELAVDLHRRGASGCLESIIETCVGLL